MLSAANGRSSQLPQEAGDLLQRGGARQLPWHRAAIIKTAVLDQGQRRFEHRRAEVERVGGDQFGLAADVAAALQPRDVVGAVAPLARPSTASERSSPRLT